MKASINTLPGFTQTSFEHIAEEFGTPCYLYSMPLLTQAFTRYQTAFTHHPHLICYAVKANPNLSIMQHLISLGAGCDIVSGGELIRALKAGCDPKKIIFSGVGKSYSEIEQALHAGILCFNVESESEFFRIKNCAQALQITAHISFRVNPNVDAQTHPYISTGLKENKFGINIKDALRLYQEAAQAKWIKIVGIDCHIGSQLTQIAPFLEAFDHILQLVDQLSAQGISLEHIDIGGGVGITYQNEPSFPLEDYAKHIVEKLGKRNISLIMEPGRAIVGPAGVLLTKVEYLKTHEERHFAIIDAAMTELLRPALYQAWHDITVVNAKNIPLKTYDIVGPVCESTDFLGKNRELAVQENDLLLIHNTGAYGSSMNSNYNSRLLVPEVMIDDFGQPTLIRRRQTYEELLENEVSCLQI